MRDVLPAKTHIQNSSIDTGRVSNDAESPKELGSRNENQFELIDFSQNKFLHRFFPVICAVFFRAT